MKGGIATLVVFGIGLLGSEAGAAGASIATATTIDASRPPPDSASGASAYSVYCAECHGARLEGARGPALLDARWRGPRAAASLERAIRDGVPARGMPAFGGVLPDAALTAIAAHVVRGNAAEVASAPPAGAGGATSAAATDSSREAIVRSDLHAFRIETRVAAGLDRPKSLAVLADGSLLVTDARGLRRIGAAEREPGPPVAGLPAHDLLEEIAPHPDHARNGWLYLTFACSAACGHPDRHVYALARGRLRDGRWVDHETLATYGDGDPSYGVSKLAFDGEGHLWLTLSGAERPGQDPDDFAADVERPASLASHRGKVFRLRDDGRVPADGPYAAHPAGETAGLAPRAVWSYGHRGLSGLHYDRATRTLWATEHGPWGGDELNRVVRGGNHGWPRTSFGYHYGGAPLGHSTLPGLEPPVFHWTPSIGVSGVLVYRGDAFPRWRGDLLVGSLGARIGRTLHRFRLVDGRAQLYAYPADAEGRVRRDAQGRALPRVPRFEELAPDAGRIRDLREGPDGYVYLLLESPDRVVRLVPAQESP